MARGIKFSLGLRCGLGLPFRPCVRLGDGWSCASRWAYAWASAWGLTCDGLLTCAGTCGFGFGLQLGQSVGLPTAHIWSCPIARNFAYGTDCA